MRFVVTTHAPDRTEWRETMAARVSVAVRDQRLARLYRGDAIRAAALLSLWIIPLWMLASFRGRATVGLLALIGLLLAGGGVIGLSLTALRFLPRSIVVEADRIRIGTSTIVRRDIEGITIRRPQLGAMAPMWMEVRTRGDGQVISFPTALGADSVLDFLSRHYRDLVRIEDL